jgi:hypothetical protein
MTNGRCRLHGGKTPGGIASPNWKHGRYSRYVPNGLRRDYERTVADPDLLSIEDLVAAQRARLCEIFRSMSQLEPPPSGSAAHALDDYLPSLREKDKNQRKKALKYLIETDREGADAKEDYRALWADARALMQEITNSTASAWKRLQALNGVVTVTDVMNVIHALLIGIRERVDDQETLRDIQDLWNRLVGAKAGPAKPSPLAISIVAEAAAE